MKHCATCILLLFLFFSSFRLQADIGHFDVVTIRWNNQTYFLTVDSYGLLKNNDLCYYNYAEGYKMEVSDYVAEYIEKIPKVIVYTELEVIQFDQFGSDEKKKDYLRPPICILKNRREVPLDSIWRRYELIGAQKGNTYGTLISPSITEADIWWVNSPSMKLLFYINTGECAYEFYSAYLEPKTKLAARIQKELEGFWDPINSNENHAEKFWQRIEALANEKILMLGECSC